MVSRITLSVLVLFVSTLALASDLPDSAKSGGHCPCQCFTPRSSEKAFYQCDEPIYKGKCAVSSCQKDPKRGKRCCDIVPPTPTPTKSPKVVPCPCICRHRGLGLAKKECKQPYISHKCKVLACGHRRSYQCCDKVDLPPTTTHSPKVVPCPCVCRPKGLRLAKRECKQPYISHKCKVLTCGYRGSYECCDKKPPTPPPSPSASPKPKCPCKCTELNVAVAQCKKLPHCSWAECGKHGFSCCDKH